MSPSAWILIFISLAAIPIRAQNTQSYSSLTDTRASSLSTSISTAFVSLDTSALPSTSSETFLGITGDQSASATATSTTSNSAAPLATNAQPCNGYVELCDRKLSNVSLVVAHNSPFAIPHNAASNQELGVLTQLGDGIRGCKLPLLHPHSHYL
jgi:hypothetical protein